MQCSNIPLNDTQISVTGSKAAATLSLDQRFMRWHFQQIADHARRSHGPRPTGSEIASLIAKPAQDLLAGAMFAATGIVVEPYKGAKMKGKAGFGKGVCIGVVGLVGKPAVGVFYAFAHFTETIQYVARSANILEKKFQPVKKLRLPYVFGTSDILLSFDPIDARSSSLLLSYPLENSKGTGDGGAKRINENWNEVLILSEILHLEPGVDLYIVVTTTIRCHL